MEDGDAAEVLQRIQEALVAGGYYRAGISSLSPFDKLTGGLAWCITASNADVDFDVFFDDDATLGEKMSAACLCFSGDSYCLRSPKASIVLVNFVQ